MASKYPNELGLYDFSGNVMEWTHMEAIICVQKMDVYCKIHGELQMTHVVDKLDLD